MIRRLVPPLDIMLDLPSFLKVVVSNAGVRYFCIGMIENGGKSQQYFCQTKRACIVQIDLRKLSVDNLYLDPRK